MNDINDKHALWNEKAKAFLVRTRQEMWGKHKHEILTFLFQYGFANKFAQDMLLGWNRRSRKRSAESWGLSGGSINIPQGIVVPWVNGQHVEKIVMVNYLDETDPHDLVIPGSLEISMMLGQASKTIVVENILDGLWIYQEKQDEVRVIIPHNLSAKPDPVAAGILNSTPDILIFPDRLKDLHNETWSSHTKKASVIPHKSKEDILNTLCQSM